jgi:hypothetical protein
MDALNGIQHDIRSIKEQQDTTIKLLKDDWMFKKEVTENLKLNTLLHSDSMTTSVQLKAGGDPGNVVGTSSNWVPPEGNSDIFSMF